MGVPVEVFLGPEDQRLIAYNELPQRPTDDPDRNVIKTKFGPEVRIGIRLDATAQSVQSAKNLLLDRI